MSEKISIRSARATLRRYVRKFPFVPIVYTRRERRALTKVVALMSQFSGRPLKK